MIERIYSLSEREIETLQLLLVGHDAKSVARLLGLSVHTVNERLRDARRKLGVSSSREAARILAEASQKDPKLLADKKMGVAGGESPQHIDPVTGHQGVWLSGTWIAGGLLVMSLSVAAFLILSALEGGGQVQAPTAPVPIVPQGQQVAMDLMPIADANNDGKVTADEYRIFSEQGWAFVSQGKDRVKLADLDQMAQMAFFAIMPDAQGFVTRQMYIEAIPARFKMFDQNADGALSSDELNGRAFQSQV